MGVVGGLSEHVVPGRFVGQPDDAPSGEPIIGLDLGSGVFISPFTASYVPEGEHAGGIVWHTHPDGQLCGGAVLFAVDPDRPDRPVWDVVSWDPLTITPSVLAHNAPSQPEGCLHGFITDGLWVPA